MPTFSKGCDNCRASKIRCDQKHPRCGRCTRTGKECQYRNPKDFIFRDLTDHTIKRSQHLIALKENANSKQHLQSLSPAYSTGPSIHRLDANYFFQIHLPPSIDPGPMTRHQAVASYCTDYFPRIKCTNDIDTSHFVFLNIFALPRKSMMLETACSALAYIFQGKIRHDEHTLQYGVGLYNKAIRNLASAISHKSETAQMEEIVYTCVIFQQIQMHYSPHGLGEWLAHIDGLTAITRHYSSDLKRIPSTPLLTTILGEYQKFRVALTGFMHLSDDTIAWLKEPNQGGTWLSYLELLTELSRITGDITNTKLSDRDAFKNLLSECLELEKKNMDFWTDLNPDKEPLTYAPGELNSGIASTDELFGPAYHFPSLDYAILHALLWTSMSFVYPMIRQCQALSQGKVLKTSSVDDMQNEEHRRSISYISRAIRCLPYCCQQGMNAWGMAYAVWVATQASRIYTHTKDLERFLWAQNVLVYLEDVGFGFAGGFREMWGNYWFETHKHDAYRVQSLKSPISKQTYPPPR